MTLPHFLIIGAMKAGTTSLYRDLRAHPRVFMPLDKEPEALTNDDVLNDAGRRRYAGLFASARPDEICGEASTAYSKLPDYPGVVDRARRVLGQDLRIIYLVRNPIHRIASHHYHLYAAGQIATADVGLAVRECPQLINWTRYAMQVRPWIDTFGRDRVRIIRFEDYIADRRTTVDDVSRFLKIESHPHLVNVDAVFNRSEGKPVITKGWRRVRLSGGYRRFVRPFIPTGLRDRVRTLLLPRAPERPPPPTAEAAQWILEQLHDDLENLREIMGLRHEVWDFAEIRSGRIESHLTSDK